VSRVWDEVLSAAREAGLVVLEDQEFADLIQAIMQRYLTSPASRWWWNSLKVPSKTIDYGEQDGLAILLEVLPDRTDLILIVTDEALVPSGAVRGTAAQLNQLLRGCSFFEFAIVPADLEWIVFDTHHNVLVGAGQLGLTESKWDLA
jgi:hypothetical protein